MSDVMKFFKFIDNEDKSLSTYEKIHYKVGSIIEVKNADTRNIQCSNGIHCILFDGTKQIYSDSILFGPRVAILEANKEDVVYFSGSGKCRLKKCKVVETYDIDNLPEELKFGRGNYAFTVKALEFLDNIKLTDKWMKFLKESNDYTFSLIIEKLDKYYSKVENYFVNNKYFDFAARYAIKHKKYNHNSIKTWINKKNFDILLELKWVATFNPEDIDKTEKEYLEKISYDYDYYKFNDVIDYAIEFNRINDNIINFILKNKRPYYEFVYDYIKKFANDPKIEKLVEKSSNYAYIYLLNNPNSKNDKIKSIVKKDYLYSVRYILNIEDSGDCDSYRKFNNICDIIEYFKKYGTNDKFLNEVSSLKYITNNETFKNLVKFRTFKNSEMIDTIFVKTSPCFGDCLEYLYYIKNTSKVVLDYIKQNFDIYYILPIVKHVGYIPQIEQILDMYNYDYKELPEIYFKVVKKLKNGTKVSAEVTKESKKREIYQNGGEPVVVKEGRVFNNIFSADDYASSVNKNNDMIIYECTGDNFSLIYDNTKWDNENITQKELDGSGKLNNIKLADAVKSSLYLYF